MLLSATVNIRRMLRAFLSVTSITDDAASAAAAAAAAAELSIVSKWVITVHGALTENAHHLWSAFIFAGRVFHTTRRSRGMAAAGEVEWFTAGVAGTESDCVDYCSTVTQSRRKQQLARQPTCSETMSPLFCHFVSHSRHNARWDTARQQSQLPRTQRQTVSPCFVSSAVVGETGIVGISFIPWPRTFDVYDLDRENKRIN